jgi:tRNA (cytidine/uridine-2'-O-)-methyltransferase
VAVPALGREAGASTLCLRRAKSADFRESAAKGANVLRVALWEPEIPPNTGNIARLCAATGAELHLIGRVGFRLDDRSLRRAGVDYWEAVTLRRHATLHEFEAALADVRVHCLSARASTPYTAAEFHDGDCLLFGGESHGLPAEVLTRYADRALLIPMPAGKVRSLNLATAVGIVLYEALRQTGAW